MITPDEKSTLSKQDVKEKGLPGQPLFPDSQLLKMNPSVRAIKSDLYRLLKSEELGQFVQINGKTGSEIMDIESKEGGIFYGNNGSFNETHVKLFLEKYLLDKTSKELKQKSLDHLLLYFNQNGYNQFAGSSVFLYNDGEILGKLKNSVKSSRTLEDELGLAIPATGNFKRTLSITTKENGLDLQDSFEVNKIEDRSFISKDTETDLSINPDKHQDYVFKVIGGIEVDFSGGTRKAVKNEVFYGSDRLKKILKNEKLEKEIKNYKKEKSNVPYSMPLEQSIDFYKEKIEETEKLISTLNSTNLEGQHNEKIHNLEKNIEFFSEKIYRSPIKIQELEGNKQAEIINEDFIELHELERQYSSLSYAKEEKTEIKKEDLKKSSFKVMEESEVEKEDIKKTLEESILNSQIKLGIIQPEHTTDQEVEKIDPDQVKKEVKLYKLEENYAKKINLIQNFPINSDPENLKKITKEAANLKTQIDQLKEESNINSSTEALDQKIAPKPTKEVPKKEDLEVSTATKKDDYKKLTKMKNSEVDLTKNESTLKSMAPTSRFSFNFGSRLFSFFKSENQPNQGLHNLPTSTKSSVPEVTTPKI